MIPGNNARIKKNEMDEALILKASLRNSSLNFINTSYIGMPSNPGKTSVLIRSLKRSERNSRLYLSKVEIKNSFVYNNENTKVYFFVKKI